MSTNTIGVTVAVIVTTVQHSSDTPAEPRICDYGELVHIVYVGGKAPANKGMHAALRNMFRMHCLWEMRLLVTPDFAL